VDEEKAASVAAHLVSPEMFSGWGVRTLAANMGAYNPASYHNGAVWPHDNALIVAGLMRYGFVDEATTISTALFDAAEHFEGRLPELFCGFDRETYSQPVPYPTSCSPQAWAAATPFSLIRSMLRLDPCVPAGGLWLDPVLPDGFGHLRMQSVPLAGARVSITVENNKVAVTGLPRTLHLHREPRANGADLEDLRG
jgi:glycogen debranching enzyme